MRITLYTSGSTKEPKQVFHDDLTVHIKRTIDEIGLSSSDRVLDIFPANVIAHYTVTALPALTSGAELISSTFDPYSYIRLFKEFSPTVIALIPNHIRILENVKGWKDLNMTSVRYMVTGSQIVTQSMIDSLLEKGVRTVANWYGMTEMPPPVLIGYNSESFCLTPKPGYDVSFSNEGECIINGFSTGDIFDLNTNKFLERKNLSNGDTWKNSN